MKNLQTHFQMETIGDFTTYVIGGDIDSTKKFLGHEKLDEEILEHVFILACTNRHQNLVELFITYGAKNFDSAVFHTINMMNELIDEEKVLQRNFVKYIVEKCDGPSVEWDRAVYACTKMGDYELVEFFLTNTGTAEGSTSPRKYKQFHIGAFMSGSAFGGHFRLLRCAMRMTNGKLKQAQINNTLLVALEGFKEYRHTRDHARVVPYLMRGATNLEEAASHAEQLVTEVPDDWTPEKCQNHMSEIALIIREYNKKNKPPVKPEDFEKFD